MKVIISEKPSVAREIAAIVGADNKEDGFLYGNGYTVTWALGHLVALAMPEDYGFSGFVKENLPIIPETFILKPRQIREGKEYKPDSGALRQLKIIQKLFEKCDKIIVATDSGREGELIFRYIYSYLNCKKPFDRLWISSLTEKAISDGLQNVKSGNQYDNLYFAAKARSEADWLCGINASQALSISAGHGVFSLGRVQTPTLAMICKRFLENKNFTPVPFWQVKVQTEKGIAAFSVVCVEKFDNREAANKVLQVLHEKQSLLVQSIEKKEVNQEPPLLYDLTTLQKEANTKHGFTADKTLSLAQKLYETHKLITYPRTGSRYISDDVFDEIPHLIKSITCPQSPKSLSTYAQAMDAATLNKRSVNAQKVTDHHALLITGNQPKELTEDERTIYTMVAGRMLESFSEKCVKEASNITFVCGDILFEAKGSVIRQTGWRGVFGVLEETGEPEMKFLPELTQGTHLPVIQSEVLEKHTKPKPLHSEASLLSAMESAGKEVTDEAEREAMKDSGIGTPATRAAIIETLLSREYIRRDKKSLIPTDKGIAVYEIVKDKRIANVSMTGSWEKALLQIERGEQDVNSFRQATEDYTRQITTELLNTAISSSFGGGQGEASCPKCKVAHVRFYPKVAKCTDANCGLTVFRAISEKQLSDKHISDLLTKGKTAIIKGFKSKNGKSFDAALKFDDNFRVIFDFVEQKWKKCFTTKTA